ncbi:MAG: DUF6538 domain-containing protein [Candidatus Phaeomarinobacter sp.]
MGTYQFRARMPENLVALIGKTEIKRSLRIKVKMVAI